MNGHNKTARRNWSSRHRQYFHIGPQAYRHSESFTDFTQNPDKPPYEVVPIQEKPTFSFADYVSPK